MKPVLFTSNRKLERAENIKAVYDAFNGKKEFVHTKPGKFDSRLNNPYYSLRVCDDFFDSSPGKAIMIGHAISGGKTYGLDQPYAYHKKKNAKLLTYVIASSTEMVPLVARQSGVPETQVLPLGVPRTDAYFGSKKGDGKTFLAEKRAYLYAPTYRNNAETQLPEINWRLIDQSLTDEEVLVVKSHMLTRKLLSKWEYKHIVEVSSDEPSTPYLIDCDVLITDYSSILFDAHLLNKPVVIFEKNPGYLRTRGMYLEYPYAYASRYCTNEIDLVAISRDAKEQKQEDILCKLLTASACDGHSTQRVVKLIWRLI